MGGMIAQLVAADYPQRTLSPDLDHVEHRHPDLPRDARGRWRC